MRRNISSGPECLFNDMEEYAIARILHLSKKLTLDPRPFTCSALRTWNILSLNKDIALMRLNRWLEMIKIVTQDAGHTGINICL